MGEGGAVMVQRGQRHITWTHDDDASAVAAMIVRDDAETVRGWRNDRLVVDGLESAVNTWAADSRVRFDILYARDLAGLVTA